MTNELKIGDRVRYKDTEDATFDGHLNGEIYTIVDIDPSAIAYFKEVRGGCAIELLELVEPRTLANKHPHFDSIMQWATDPTNTTVQYRESDKQEWTDIRGSPSWLYHSQYRIKPKTKIVQMYQYAFLSKSRNETSISVSHFTDEMWTKHAKHFNISNFVRLDWTCEAKDVPIDS